MAVVVHPDLEIETAKARALLGTTVPLADAIRQWANLGALVDGLHRGDFALISRALEDTIAEPRRASLVPGLAAIKQAAVDAGALGCSLSGSGPSLFALCRGTDAAPARGGRDDARRPGAHRRRAADLRVGDRSRRAPASSHHALRNDEERRSGQTPAVSFSVRAVRRASRPTAGCTSPSRSRRGRPEELRGAAAG